eukprot:TRINITY_DN769_c0_g2_i1.p1 TRINITY_DN769_c0_g2~~TRINITY_DN769_c0_g2_i1.p1  ORF type:complete len:1872 (+),score=378.58 TRINITY_DN769_c0_g2_i1:39-5654(+)
MSLDSSLPHNPLQLAEEDSSPNDIAQEEENHNQSQPQSHQDSSSVLDTPCDNENTAMNGNDENDENPTQGIQESRPILHTPIDNDMNDNNVSQAIEFKDSDSDSSITPPFNHVSSEDLPTSVSHESSIEVSFSHQSNSSLPSSSLCIEESADPHISTPVLLIGERSSPNSSLDSNTNSVLTTSYSDLLNSPSSSSISLQIKSPLDMDVSGGEDNEEDRENLFKSPTLSRSSEPIQQLPDHTWSHFEGSYNAPENNNDVFIDLLRFPPSSVSVTKMPRQWRTEGPCVPAELLADRSLSAFIKDCVGVYTMDWTVISLTKEEEEELKGEEKTRKHLSILKSNKDMVSGLIPTLISSDSLTLSRRQQKEFYNNAPTILDPSIMEPPDSIDLNCERKDLFQTYSRVSDVIKRNVIDPFPKNVDTQIILQCKELRLGEVEPFFCSIALYDVQKKVKLSESFNFELNGTAALSDLDMFEGKQQSFQKESLSRTAILTLPDATKGIFLILRVYKLLRPENEKYLSLYTKKSVSLIRSGQFQPPIKSKELEKIKKETKELTGTLQPFVWSYVSLSDVKDEMTGIVGGEIIADDFRFLSKNGTFTDEQICEVLSSERDLKKNKGHILGEFVIDILKQTKKIKGLRINNSYLPIKPFPTIKEEQEFGVLKELQPFMARNRPKLSYCNNLYVYPESCSFKVNNINIMIDVCLKPYPNGTPIPSVYSNLPGSNFITNATTSATLKDRKPLFTEEIKLQLPGKLTPQHHLFFTFFNVNPQADSKKKDKNSHLTVLGYAYLPLYRDGRFLSDDRYTVYPVAELPPNYLKETAPQDAKKYPFVFRIRSFTIYPKDRNLVNFSEAIQYVPEWDFAMASHKSFYSALKKIEPTSVVEHFIVILNELFHAMCTRIEQAARDAFLGIIYVLNIVSKTVDEKSSHHSLLLSYVRYVFTAISEAKENRQVHNEIVKHWLHFLERKHNYFDHFNFNWFLLDVITKSMTITLFGNGKKPDESKRSEWFSEEFMKDLTALAKVLFIHVGKDKKLSHDYFNSFNIFLKDLFHLMDRGFVFKLIHTIFSALSSNKNDQIFASTVKFKILTALAHFEHYVQLNLPVEVHIYSISSIRDDFRKRHYPASLLISEIELSLSNGRNQKMASTQGLMVLLKSILKKHETDTKDDKPRRERLTDIYFPFIVCVIENHKEIKSLESDWFLCCFFILKNCSRRLLCEWWKMEPQRRQVDFFSILMHSLKVFENDNLHVEICCIVLELVIVLTIKDIDELQQPNNPVTPKIFELIQLLLRKESFDILSMVYTPFLRKIVHLLSKTLFLLPDTSSCEAINVEILRHCNDPEVRLRNMASSMFFLMLQKNLKEVGNIHRMFVQSTVAISRLVGENRLKDYSLLNMSLESIKIFARSNVGSQFGLIEDLINQIFALLRYNAQIAENSFDPEIVADIYHKISLSYFNSPNLRVTWLNNLSSFHESKHNYEEAGLCKINIAVLVVQYLERNKHHLPISKLSFQCVSPAIMEEPGLPENCESDESLFKSNNIWRQQGLLETLKEATALMVKATMYEIAMELYSILTLLYKSARNYTELSNSLTDYLANSRLLVESNKKGRLFPKFYRVGFYGAMLKDLDMDGKEYIYKREARVNLSVMQQQLKDTYSPKVGLENIVIIPNTEVDPSTLEPNKIYIQIASVRQFSAMTENSHDSPFDQYFNANEFIFESAHTAGKGLQQSETSQQQKKKSIFGCELSFPYIKNRLLIIKKSEVILTPLENAIELLEERILRLRQELNAAEPRVNVLQQLLQGSVVPMVNEGPLKICEIFLAEQQRYPEEQVQELKRVLQQFSRDCGFALSLNKSLITPEYVDFHQMLNDRYKIMRDKIREYTD